MKKFLLTVKTAHERIKVLSASMAQGEINLQGELNKIASEGRSEAWTKDAQDNARKSALEAGYKSLSEIQELQRTIRKHESYFLDREAVLSDIPLTATDVSQLAPANELAEAMERMRVLTEANNWSGERIARQASYALLSGDIGKAHLLSTIRNNEGKVDLSQVEIPAMQAGLDAIREANTLAGTAFISFKKMSGVRADRLSIDKLNVGHGVDITA